ncbi:MAG: 3-oxoacyl-ACP reductase FabG [Candidatus Zixiibacteriota bacterium]|nr:MAG: 3-oxoacyl-ACP reductase FabG [candidate division Zixibacteria bacterium]
MTFQGKSVVVTGGARGIGSAIVERFTAEGANVAILDLDVSEVPADSGILAVSGDVSRADDVTAFIGEVMAKHGRIDILVNNAGIIRDNVIWRMTEEEFDAVLRVNLKGAWLMCKQVAPVMREQNNGRIINIASRAWLGNFGQSNYSSSKGGLVSLTRVLALELARYNVTVNAVAPGLIDTPLTRGLPEETLRKLTAAQPGGRAGKPEDIAAAVAFLASPEAGFINGQVLHVDGGKSIGATVF